MRSVGEKACVRAVLLMFFIMETPRAQTGMMLFYTGCCANLH